MPVTRSVPPHAVDRADLLARLDAGVDAPLSLVVAPAGSGKSVLLTQWALSRREDRVGWIDLTPADEDAVVFSRRLVAEICSLHPALSSFEAPMVTPDGGLGDAFLESLAAAFIDVGGRFILIFDDLHRVSNPQLLSDLWRLVDLVPPNVHIVFSSRIDFRLGWSRHRLQYGLVELRQAELAFDVDRAAELLEQITRRPVDPTTAATVVDHTEGWAAGIQLSGLSLRFRRPGAEVADVLMATDRLATDYLSEEVLDSQSAQRRRTLLRLSVLEEVNPALAEAVAGIDDGSEFLRDLEAESMFIVAVAGKPGHYRFHQLFRDVLRHRLMATDPGAESDLLAAAADWHERQGDTATAIEYLLAAKRWDRAMDIILSIGREAYERGETGTVARWLAMVPVDVRSARVAAELLYGIVEGFSGRAAKTEEVLRKVLLDADLPIGPQLVARSFLAACVQFRPHAERYLEEGKRMLALADRAADVTPPDLLQLTNAEFLTTLAMASIGRAHFYLGGGNEARVWLRRALESVGGAYGPFRVHILGSLALADAWQGKLTRAGEFADEALELARELSLLTHPAPADAYLARSLIAVQRGEPASGAFALHEGTVRAAANGRTQLVWVAHAISRLVDSDGVNDADPGPDVPAPPLVRDALAAITHRELRRSGRPVHPGTAGSGSLRGFEAVAGMLADGNLRDARAQLDGLIGHDTLSPVAQVDLGILQAWLAALEGRQVESRRFLLAAIDAAASEKLVHPFIRAGKPVIDLVRALPGPPSGFRRLILDRYQPARPPSPDDSYEPLTARELELLGYLPSRLTNADLAARCFVSVNTIKTHMAHIYRKLGATGRDAAIIRARELGLLPPVGAGEA